jgi:Ca2+-binding EF-hand superfamily protein
VHVHQHCALPCTQGAGVPLTLKELDDIFTWFDRDRSGTVSFTEFTNGLKPEPSQRRLALIRTAFSELDVTGDGRVTLEDLQGRYDPSWHPEVRNGSKSADESLRAFLRQWDVDADGTVTAEEFVSYYRVSDPLVNGDSP